MFPALGGVWVNKRGGKYTSIFSVVDLDAKEKIREGAFDPGQI